MKHDFTDRILVTGAVGFSLAATGLVCIMACDLVHILWNWHEEAQSSEVTQWIQLPFRVLFLFLPAALITAVWRRIVFRRRARAAAGYSSVCSSLPQSHGKYAAWSFARPAHVRNAFGPLRTRKKMGR